MTTHSKLWGEALRAAVGPWREELGKSDRDRLDALVGLSVREDIRLSDCLTALFPNVDTQKAQTALTSFRKRLNDAATEEGRPNLGLRFEVDTKKKNPPRSVTAGSPGLIPPWRRRSATLSNSRPTSRASP
ncbi:hypothetical protein ACN28S_04660 [Cystobacter fuscus]